MLQVSRYKYRYLIDELPVPLTTCRALDRPDMAKHNIVALGAGFHLLASCP